MENKIRVLVVDDEPLARRGIRQLLESEKDFEIAGEAANGHANSASFVSRTLKNQRTTSFASYLCH